MDVHFTGHGAATRPLPQQDATHLHLRPTDAALSPAAVTQGFCRLHSSDTDTDGWTDRLFGTRAPTFEFRLQRPAGPDADLALYAGSTDAPTATLHEGLRTACPNEYELTPATPEPPAAVETPTPDGGDIPLAAVEWVGDAERRDDWQTQLTPFAVFQATDDTRAAAGGDRRGTDRHHRGGHLSSGVSPVSRLAR